MKVIDDRYLGDGVYASCGGKYILLDLKTPGFTKIALWPHVLAELDRFRKDIERLLAAQETAGEPGKEGTHG